MTAGLIEKEAVFPPAAAHVAAAPQSFSKSFMHVFTGQLAAGVIALLTESLYARILGPSSRGTLSLCAMSVGFAGLIGGLGGEGSITYWSSRTNRAHASWLPSVLLWASMGTMIACVLWIAAYWHFHFNFLRGITPKAALLVLVSIPFAILFAYSMAFLAGTEDFRLRSISAFIRQVTSIAVFFSFAVLAGPSVESALWGALFGFVAASATALGATRRNLADFWKIKQASHNLKSTLIYGLRGHVGNLATFFTYRLDVFIVNYFLRPAELGFYALGVVVSEALWQVPQAVASTLFPRTARTLEWNEVESARFTCSILRQVLLVSVVCGVLLAIAAPVAIPIVFGTAFARSIGVVLWILPGTVALSLGKVACADLAGRGKNGYSSIFALIGFAITIGLDWLLIPRLGIIGAAIASSIAYSANTFLILLAVRHELHVTWAEILLPTVQDIATFRAAWSRLVQNCLDYFTQTRKESRSFQSTGDEPKHE